MNLTRVAWRKASYSTGDNNCVEVATRPGVVAVRDSKNQAGPPLTFTPAQWRRFTTPLRAHRNVPPTHHPLQAHSGLRPAHHPLRAERDA